MENGERLLRGWYVADRHDKGFALGRGSRDRKRGDRNSYQSLYIRAIDLT